MREIISASVLAAVPLLLAALGGLVAERAGVLNVGLEGLMLFGAFACAWTAAFSGVESAGFFAALGAGALLAALLAVVVVSLRADQVVVGIAFNILALGVTSYGLDVITSRKGLEALTIPRGDVKQEIPGLDEIPWLGAVFDQHWIAYLAYALVPACIVLIFKTGVGVRLRAAGEYADGARASGIPVVRVRLLAMAVSGALAAAAGAFLVLGDIRVFQQNMSGGRGYIALAVIILGRWTPGGVLASAALFGAAAAISFDVQARGIGIPGELVLALPYIVTLIAVAIGGRRARPPAEEGRPLHLSR